MRTWAVLLLFCVLFQYVNCDVDSGDENPDPETPDDEGSGDDDDILDRRGKSKTPEEKEEETKKPDPVVFIPMSAEDILGNNPKLVNVQKEKTENPEEPKKTKAPSKKPDKKPSKNKPKDDKKKDKPKDKKPAKNDKKPEKGKETKPKPSKPDKNKPTKQKDNKKKGKPKDIKPAKDTKKSEKDKEAKPTKDDKKPSKKPSKPKKPAEKPKKPGKGSSNDDERKLKIPKPDKNKKPEKEKAPEKPKKKPAAKETDKKKDDKGKKEKKPEKKPEKSDGKKDDKPKKKPDKKEPKKPDKKEPKKPEKAEDKKPASKNEKKKPSDCRDVSKKDLAKWDGKGGYATLYLKNDKYRVYCDITTDGGGWMVFQRRGDGSQDFNQNLKAYEEGFGNGKEFWLGLKTMNQFMKDDDCELRVDMTDWKGREAFAKYGSFSVSGRNKNYALSIGKYSGTAGDSLSAHDGSKFSTKDGDYDKASISCAVRYSSGFWFANCFQSNPNGKYVKDGSKTLWGAGIVWKSWRGYEYSLKSVEMKFRSKK